MRPRNFISKIIISTFLLFNGLAGFSQLQKELIYGIVKDERGMPIKDAEVTILFNKNVVEKVASNEDGFYKIEFFNYGGIKKITIGAQKDGFENYLVNEFLVPDEKNIVLEKSPLKRDFPFRPEWCYHRRIATSNSLLSASWSYTFKADNSMFRTPYGTFAYNKPGLYEPVYYYENITYNFTVVDEKGMPIENARVEIKVPDDVTRWGITDKNGKLLMNMQFEKGARNGNTTIIAEGFKTKKLLFQTYDPTNKSTINLRKVK